MDVAAIFDGVGRPAMISAASFQRFGGAYMPDDWCVIDQPGAVAGLGAQTMRAGYFDADVVAVSCPVPLVDALIEPELSIDPDDIADELALDKAFTVDRLAALRRRFAMQNHPDRMAPDRRARATTRMTIANAMIDSAAARLRR